jgi:hypothetical protein
MTDVKLAIGVNSIGSFSKDHRRFLNQYQFGLRFRVTSLGLVAVLEGGVCV